MKESFGPRIVGQSQTVPGAVDVEAEDGNIYPIAPDDPAIAHLTKPAPAPNPVGDMLMGQMGAADRAALSGPSPATPAPEYMKPDAPDASFLRQNAAPMPAGYSHPMAPAPKPQAVPQGGGVKYEATRPAPAEPQGSQAPNDPFAVAMGDIAAIEARNAGRYGGGGGPIRTVKSSQEYRALTDAQRDELGRLGSQATTSGMMATEARGQALEAQSDAATEAARIHDAVAKQQEAEAARMAERRKFTEARLAEVEAKRLAAEADADSAEKAALPKEVGSRIVAAIGMMFGGMADGRAGTPGQTMQFIQRNLDNELERQKQEVREKRAKPGQYLNAYHEMLSQLGSEQAASEATMGLMQKSAMVKLDKVTAGMQSKEALSKRDELRAMADAEAAQRQANAINESAPLITDESVKKTGGGGGRKPILSPEAQLKYVQEMREKMGKTGEDGLMSFGGFKMTQDLDAGERAEARKRVAGHQEFRTGLSEIKRLREAYMKDKTNLDLRASLQTAADDVLMAKAKMTGGVVTESDKAWAKGLMGNPEEILQLTGDARLSQLQSQTDKMFDAQASAWGLVREGGEQSEAMRAVQSAGGVRRGGGG